MKQIRSIILFIYLAHFISELRNQPFTDNQEWNQNIHCSFFSIKLFKTNLLLNFESMKFQQSWQGFNYTQNVSKKISELYRAEFDWSKKQIEKKLDHNSADTPRQYSLPFESCQGV